MQLGIYRHYNGNQYKVLGIVKHSETLEDMVLYEAQYGDHQLWVRPAAMFDEMVDHNGQRVKRFTFLHE